MKGLVVLRAARFAVCSYFEHFDKKSQFVKSNKIYFQFTP